MRKSVKQDDVGYDPKAYKYEVYLDGIFLQDCHTADEEKGVAYTSFGEKKGKVEIRLSDHDKP